MQVVAATSWNRSLPLRRVKLLKRGRWRKSKYERWSSVHAGNPDVCVLCRTRKVQYRDVNSGRLYGRNFSLSAPPMLPQVLLLVLLILTYDINWSTMLLMSILWSGKKLYFFIFAITFVKLYCSFIIFGVQMLKYICNRIAHLSWWVFLPYLVKCNYYVCVVKYFPTL